MADMYCICRKPAGSRFMVGCDGCDEWYHGRCIGVSSKQKLPDQWYCPKCVCDGKDRINPSNPDGQLRTIVDEVYTETKNLVQEVASLKLAIQSKDVEMKSLTQDVIKEMRGQLLTLNTVLTNEKEYVNKLETKGNQILLLQQQVDDLSVQLVSSNRTIFNTNEEVGKRDEQIKVLQQQLDNLRSQVESYERAKKEGKEEELTGKAMNEQKTTVTTVLKPKQSSKESQILSTSSQTASKRKQKLTLKPKAESQPVPSKNRYDLNDEDAFQSPNKKRNLKAGMLLF